MDYILEIRNPDNIEGERLERLLRQYISMMIRYNSYVPVEIFDTVNDREDALQKREHPCQANHTNEKMIRYSGMDFCPAEDYFYTSVNIREKDTEYFHQGRGALVPRIYQVQPEDMIQPLWWTQQPSFTIAFPTYTISDNELEQYGFRWIQGEKPFTSRPFPLGTEFIVAMDYIRKGGR